MQGYIPRRTKNIIVSHQFGYMVEPRQHPTSDGLRIIERLWLKMDFKIDTHDGREYHLDVRSIPTDPCYDLDHQQKNYIENNLSAGFHEMFSAIHEHYDEFDNELYYMVFVSDGEWLMISAEMLVEMRGIIPLLTQLLIDDVFVRYDLVPIVS